MVEINDKEYKALQARLKEVEASEKRLRFIVDNSVDVIYTLDLTGQYTYVSPSAKKLLGYTAQEALSLRPEQVMAPESFKRQAEALSRALQKQVDYESWSETLELELVRKDGSTIWGEINARLITNEKGVPVSILGIARDITERKRAEAELKQSEAKFAKVFQAAPVLMAVSTIEEGRVIDVNDLFLSSLGYTKEEVVGRTSTELNLFADHKQRDEAMALYRQNGRLSNFEVIIRGKDGKVHPMLFSIEMIDLAAERYLLTQAIDITERKRLEAAVREKMNEYRLISESAVGQELKIIELEKEVARLKRGANG